MKKVPVVTVAASKSSTFSPVVARKEIYKSPVVVGVRVPSIPRHRKSEIAGEYHECAAPVKGGKVLHFFRNLPKGALEGTRVNAQTSLWVREHEDKSHSIYMECECVPDQKVEATHELVVHSVKAQFTFKPDRTIFSSPVPGLEGMVEIRKVAPPKSRPAK